MVSSKRGQKGGDVEPKSNVSLVQTIQGAIFVTVSEKISRNSNASTFFILMLLKDIFPPEKNRGNKA